MPLPSNLDYKIIHGFQHTGSVTIRIFDTDLFRETGCEDSAEVFSVDISTERGMTTVVVNEDDKEVSKFSIEDLTPAEANEDVKLFATTTYDHLPPNCS